MKATRLAFCGLFAVLPLMAAADISVGDLPGNTVWYLHADLAAMRDSDGGRTVYAWFDHEVGDEVREETGIDISGEVDSVTAFANRDSGPVILVRGPVSKETRDKLLAIAAAEGPVDPREHDGKTYYFFGDPDDEDASQGQAVDDLEDTFDDLEDSTYVSFAIDGAVIITAREVQMQELLENGGRTIAPPGSDSALLILSANKTLVQAGVQPAGLADEGDDDWESSIVRNTEQAALLVADESGMLAIEAQLVSSDPKMAEAIGGIVNGLIGLQALNGDLEPELQNLIRNTKVEVRDRTLEISTVLDPNVVVDVLDD
jgi:hypothetical protein